MESCKSKPDHPGSTWERAFSTLKKPSPNETAQREDSFHNIVLFFFLEGGPHPWHMEIPRLGGQLELQPLAYTTATAMQDPSCVCDLHHSSRQHRIVNPLSNRQTRNLMVPSRIC